MTSYALIDDVVLLQRHHLNQNAYDELATKVCRTLRIAAEAISCEGSQGIPRLNDGLVEIQK